MESTEESVYKCGGEVFMIIFSDRLRAETNEVVIDEQKPGRGCVDQIFAVRQVIKKVIKNDKVAFAAFLDLVKAYV